MAEDFDVLGTSPQDMKILGNAGHVTNVSRCYHAPFWERPDMVRGTHWDDFRTTRWVGNTCTRIKHVITPKGSIELVPEEKIVPIRLHPGKLTRFDNLMVLSHLFQFQTMTEEQLLVMTGLPLDRVKKALDILFTAGIIDYLSEEENEKFYYTGRIWHCVDNRKEFWDWVDKLAPGIRIPLMGGLMRHTYKTAPGGNSPYSVRHNLIATDVIIRAFEACDNIAGFWGEPFLSVDNFSQFDEASGYEYRANHGDGALVTRDGKIIIFEFIGGSLTSASSFDRIVSKAAAWTAATGSSQHDIAVVFVNMHEPDNYSRVVRAVQIGSRDIAYKYGNQLAVMNGQPCMFTVNAPQWFPALGCISDNFTTLSGFNVDASRTMPVTLPRVHSSSYDTRVNIVTNTLLSPISPPWAHNRRIEFLTDYDVDDDVAAIYQKKVETALSHDRIKDNYEWEGGVYSLDRDNQ